MINLLVAIRLWGEEWQHQHVKFYVDNNLVVQIFNTGYTRDKVLAACIRNIWFYMSLWDISVQVNPIPGYQNKTADLLSRWNNSVEHHNRLNILVKESTWCTVSQALFHLDYNI